MAGSNSGKSQTRAWVISGLGILVSGVALWWVLRDVSFSEVITEARQVDPLLLALCVFLATLPFYLRAIRWRYLLQKDSGKLPLTPLWHATAIGFMANNVLPARAGEVARIFAAGKLTGVRYSASFASVAIERVFDGVTMIGLMLLAMLAGGLPAGAEINGTPVMRFVELGSLAFGGALVLAAIAAWRPRYWVDLVRRFASLVATEKIADTAAGLADGILSGLSSLRDGSRLGNTILWSLAVWVCNGLAFLAAILAFDLPVPWTSAFVLQAIIGFGIAVPSAPGFLGVFEGAIRVTFVGIYGLTAAQALSYALVYHFFTFIPITVLGFWSLSRAHLHISDLRQADIDPGAP